MENLIQQIKNNNKDLRPEEIEGLLFILKSEIEITNNSFVTLTGLPKETLRKFKNSVSDLLEKSEDEKIKINEDGKKILSILDVKPYKWSLSESFNFFSEGKYPEILEKIKEIKIKYSPKPKREYDQFLATPETSYLKSRILIEKGLVEGKSIAFIGDDDLNSLCLASMSDKYKNISVFDIDEEIINSIEKFSKEKNLEKIKVIKYDARKDLEKQHLGKYDIVVFDPPYTKSGVTAFLHRALELLGSVNDFEDKYVFMYYGNSFKSPEKILKIQEIINRFGFSIEDRLEKFARYTGAESIGNASSLYILKANKFTKLIGNDFENIYTFEKTWEEKFPFVDHLVFKVFGVQKELLLSKSRLMGSVEKICKDHRLKVVDKKVTDFKGGGVTVSFILANSNLTVHTWPEHSSVHVDLITCSPIFHKDCLPKTVETVFDTKKVETYFIE